MEFEDFPGDSFVDLDGFVAFDPPRHERCWPSDPQIIRRCPLDAWTRATGPVPLASGDGFAVANFAAVTQTFLLNWQATAKISRRTFTTPKKLLNDIYMIKLVRDTWKELAQLLLHVCLFSVPTFPSKMASPYDKVMIERVSKAVSTHQNIALQLLFGGPKTSNYPQPTPKK